MDSDTRLLTVRTWDMQFPRCLTIVPWHELMFHSYLLYAEIVDYRKMVHVGVFSGNCSAFPAVPQKPPQPFSVGIPGEQKSLVMTSPDLQKLLGRCGLFIDFPAMLKRDYLILTAVNNQLGRRDDTYLVNCCIPVFRNVFYGQPWIILPWR